MKNRKLCVKYPYVYGTICGAYMHLENNPLSWGVVYGVICSLLAGCIIYCTFNHQIEFGVVALIIGAFIPYVLIKPALSEMITWFNCTGIEGDCIFGGKYFLIKTNGEPCQLNYTNIDSSRFEFVTKETMSRCAKLNAVAFKDSNWRNSLDNKFQRNSEHYEKNDKCIMLLKNREDYICGFTHILPVNESVWNLYMDGKIGDNGFAASQICPSEFPVDPLNKEDLPYGLIIFSVASVGIQRDFQHSANYRGDLGDFLEQAIVFHLKTLCDKYFAGQRGRRIPVLLQNMDKCFYNFFKPCAISTTKMSKDKVRIISFQISNV